MKYIQHQHIKRLLFIMQKICFYYLYKDTTAFNDMRFSFKDSDLLYTNVIEIRHDNKVEYISLLKEPEKSVKKKLLDEKEATITIYYKNKRNSKHFKSEIIHRDFNGLYENFISYVFCHKNIKNKALKKTLDIIIAEGNQILENDSYLQTIESIRDLLNNKDDTQEKNFSSLSSQLQKILHECKHPLLSPDDKKKNFHNSNSVNFWLLYHGLFIGENKLKTIFTKCYKYHSYSNFSKYNGTVCFSPPKSFNDPFDVNCFLDPQTGTIDNNSSDRDLFRVFCSTDSYDNLLMWAHYGDDHKGVCIEYNTDSIITNVEAKMSRYGYDLIIVGNVIYHKSKKEKRKKLGPIKNYFSIYNLIEAAFWKSKHWEYESEFRFVIVDFNGFNKQSHISVKVNIDNIYLGVNMDTTTKSYYAGKPNFHELKLSDDEYKVTL